MDPRERAVGHLARAHRGCGRPCRLGGGGGSPAQPGPPGRPRQQGRAPAERHPPVRRLRWPAERPAVPRRVPVPPGGHVRIAQARTDAEVVATIVTRLAQPDAASLLAAPSGGASDVAELAARAGKLRQRKAMLAGLLAAGEMDAEEWT